VVCLKRWTVHLFGWTVICLISIMSNDGFALSEYVTPVVDRNPLVEFGTMSKAPKEKGSHFKQVIQAGLRVPGPDHYKKDILEKSFTSNCKGGGFSKLSRSWNKHPSTPAVGQYKTENDHTTPRILGGSCPKKERGCHHFDEAVYHSKTSPAFAKYNADPVKNRVKVMSFTTPKTEARLTKKVSPIGPGFYNPNYVADENIPAYTAPKDPLRSFIDADVKRSKSLPAPGHVGIPEPKNHNLEGKRNHIMRMLHDRDCPPRPTAR